MINRKAEEVDLDRVGEQLGALEDRCATMQQHVGVAVRFVEWFSERGSAYEQNFHAVERQLSELARTSAPANRQPYSGRVNLWVNHDRPN